MHSEPPVLEFLRHKSLTELKATHGVNVRADNACTKFILNYDQLEARDGDPVSECCRGLILRPKNLKLPFHPEEFKNVVIGECEVLSRPMNRFYNSGQGAAAKVDLQASTIEEKLDGTMTALYWDTLHKSWCVSTRGVPEADVIINGDGIKHVLTFGQLFFMTLDLNRAEYFDGYLHPFSKENTYIFELTSPYNRIVVDYKQNNLTLLTIRNNQTGLEVDDPGVELPQFPRPRTWDLQNPSFEVAAALASTFDPEALEGFVIIDRSTPGCPKRVKVKSERWLAANGTKTGVMNSRRNLLRAIISGTIDDVIPLLSTEAQEKVQTMITTFKDYLARCEQDYSQWALEAGKGNFKGFAELVGVSSYTNKGQFFSVFREKAASITEYWKNTELSDSMIDQVLREIEK